MIWTVLGQAALAFWNANKKWILFGALIFVLTSVGCRMTGRRINQFNVNRIERQHQREWNSHVARCGCDGQRDQGRRRLFPRAENENEDIPWWVSAFGSVVDPDISGADVIEHEPTEAAPEVIESPTQDTDL